MRPELNSTLKAKKLLLAGYEPREIKKVIPDILSATICCAARRLGMKPFKRGRPVGSISETNRVRLEIIKAALKRGDAQAKIASSLGLSRERISQLLHPERNRARQSVHRNLSSGKLLKPERCEKCSRSRQLEAHHPDYSSHLLVQWLCKKCHTKIGMKKNLTYIAESAYMKPVKTKFKSTAILKPDGIANGAAIRELRKHSKASMRWVAGEIGISVPYLSDLELGNRSFSEDLFNRAKDAISRHKNGKR